MLGKRRSMDQNCGGVQRTKYNTAPAWPAAKLLEGSQEDMQKETGRRKGNWYFCRCVTHCSLLAGAVSACIA